jgi:hypothetical protein
VLEAAEPEPPTAEEELGVKPWPGEPPADGPFEDECFSSNGIVADDEAIGAQQEGGEA